MKATFDPWDFARQLERELSEANRRLEVLQAELDTRPDHPEMQEALRRLAEARPSAEAVHFARMALGMIPEERGATWSEATVIPMSQEVLRIAEATK